jgi:RNA polymerase sigma-70 factor (ECF subfamily)
VATSGDEDAFSELVREEGDGLFRFLFWSLGRREDALDALQEVLIRVHRGLPGLRDAGTRHGWLYRIATNVAHDTRARRKRAPASLAAFDENAETRLGGSPELGPSAALEARETSERLQAALASLPAELREPLVLHVVSGMKYREIADSLGWPIGTVTSRIHAARLALQEALEPD